MDERPYEADRLDGSDTLLRSAAPVTNRQLDEPALRDALARLAAEAAATTPGDLADSRAAGRWRRRVAGVSLGSALVVAGAAGSAAAGAAAWLQWFDSPSSTESISGEAYVDVRSPEMAAAVERAVADYPLPPGQSWDDWRHALQAAGGVQQVSGMRGQAALYGGCPWTREWLTAESRHDADARSAAARALDRIAESPDAAAVDGGGIADAARDRAAAAARGDAAWLTRYADEWCTDQ